MNGPELSLQAKNQSLQACLDCLEIIVFSVDGQYRYTGFSEACVLSMRAAYGTEIALGVSLLDCVTDAEDRARAKANLDRTLAGEAFVDESFPWGKPRAGAYFQIRHQPCRDAEGKCTGALVTARELVNPAEALAESEKRLQILLGQTSVGVVEVDPATRRYMSCNQKFCDLLGYSREELLGMTVDAITHPEDLGKSRNYMQDLRECRIQEFTTEKRYVRKDGDIVWGRTTVSRLKPGADGAERDLAVIQDISEQKAADQALAESHRLLQDLMDHSPALIYVVDTQGRFLRINRQAAKILGHTRDEIIGKARADILPKDEAEAHEEHDRLVAASCQAHIFEETHRQPGGARTYLSAKFPLRNEQGEVYAICGLSTDITDRKQIEGALRESEEIFDKFMENSPIYIFFKNENIQAVRLSHNFETMLGRPIQELLGKSMDELFPSELARSMVQDDLRILNSGKKITIEEELHGRCYSTTKFPILIDGKPRYLAGYTIDITEQRRAEKAINSQLEELRRWHDATLGREVRILELKQEVNELLASQGKPPRYGSMLNEATP